MKINITWIAKN